MGPEDNISIALGWIAVMFRTDIYGPQSMNTNSSGDPLTFLIFFIVNLFWFMTTNGWTTLKFGTDSHVAWIINTNDFGEPMTF